MKEKLKAVYRNSKNTFSCKVYEGEITHRKIAEFQEQAVGTEIDTVIDVYKRQDIYNLCIFRR